MKKIKKWLKSKTKMDFSDWGVFFILATGTLLILFIEYFTKNIYFISEIDLTTSEKVSAFVLWFTATMIAQYTKETYWLKQTEVKNLKFQKAPFVIAHFETKPASYDIDGKPGRSIEDCFVFKNMGRGVARNVEWKIVAENELSPCLSKIPTNYPKKTVISPSSGNTKICHTNRYAPFKPSSRYFYFIEINYENLDGIKYYTYLKSGTTNDDYEILEYKEMK